MSCLHDLCSISDLAENTARGFSVDNKDNCQEIFIVRKNNQVYGYMNHCPHTGVNLDWQPDQFLDLDGKYIQCSTHGAIFRIEDGICIYGPCAGKSLTPVSLLQEHNIIKLIQK